VGAALTVGAALGTAATLADVLALGASAVAEGVDVSLVPVTAVLLDAHARKGRRTKTNVRLCMHAS